MRNVILVGAVLLAAGIATAIPLASMSNVVGAGSGPLTEARLVALLGGHHQDTVRILMPDGGVRVVTWEEHLALLAPLNSVGASVGGLPCLPLCLGDEGGDALDGRCGTSAFIMYDASLTAGGPGSSFVEVTSKGARPGACGGQRLKVVMSVYPVATGMLPRVSAAFDGCYAEHWANQGPGYCPKPFTALDTFGVFEAEGPGAVGTVDYGGGYVLDYYMGDGAMVRYR